MAQEDSSSKGYPPKKAWLIKAKGKFEIVEVTLTGYKDIQKYFGGLFDVCQIGQADGIIYVMYMHDNGIRLKLQPNKNAKRLIPDFDCMILGDVVVATIDPKNGQKVDLDVTVEELMEIASKFLK